jgi:hypothetical protein
VRVCVGAHVQVTFSCLQVRAEDLGDHPKTERGAIEYPSIAKKLGY